MTAGQLDKEETKNSIRVMDANGDTRIEWTPGNAAEEKAARTMYNTLKAKQYLAYRVNDDGGNGEVLRDFDPEAAEIIMRPQLVGG